jgi:curli biogenesis system outer membrane secretion channel CsgG
MPNSLFKLFFALLVFGLSSMTFAAGITYVAVKTQGTGDNENYAIASALAAAVAQVNGASVEADSVLSEMMVAIDTGDASQAAFASTSAETISQKTKGTVRDYKVISSSETEGIWTVSVESRIAKFQRSAQSERLRLAVLPFRTSHEEHAHASDQFANQLASQLTQTRRFAILDRDYEKERQDEMEINLSDDSPAEEMARLGHRLGTDLMIVGVVEDASTSVSTTQIAGRTLQSARTRFTVNYRVVDAATGQIKFSDTWSKESEGSNVATLIGSASENIARSIIEGIFPVAVESVSGNLVFLGQGGSSIKPGQQYRLIHLGSSIVDRYTGESLGREEHDIGLLEIVDVQSKFSKAKILHTDIDLAEHFQPALFIVRLASQPKTISSSRNPKQEGQPIKTKKEIKADLESSW